MSIKKGKGLLDDLADTRQFFNRSDADNKTKGGAFYASSHQTKTAHKPMSIADQIRVAANFKQAVVKITNYGRDSAKIGEHFSYISRNYQLDLEDQDGEIIKTKENGEELLNNWHIIYFDHKINSRNTVHITFSAPESSNRDDFNKTIRECLNEEFGGRNDYVFAQHNDTDHPHAHAVIVMRSIKGQKLDPRKQYLNHLRHFFATKCRDNGIMVEASKRCERGLGGTSRNSSMIQMYKQRGAISKSDFKLRDKLKNEGLPNEKPSKKRNMEIREHYFKHR